MAQSRIVRRGAGAVSFLDRLLYTGRMLYCIRFMDSKAYHLFTLETSGVLSVIGALTGDIWLCGGGGGGAAGRYVSSTSTGDSGAGGGGGFVTNIFNIPIHSGVVTIGAGTDSASTSTYTPLIGGSTSYLSYSAAGGQSAYIYYSYPAYYSIGGSGGSAGAGGTAARSGSGAGVSTRPFLCADMPPQCGGGGGGGTLGTVKLPCGGSDGGGATPHENSSATPAIGAGGAFGGSGGGNAGGSGGSFGSPGYMAGGGAGGGFGYGGGGGGAGAATSFVTNPRGGHGAPGALMIRIPV